MKPALFMSVIGGAPLPAALLIAILAVQPATAQAQAPPLFDDVRLRIVGPDVTGDRW